MVFSFMEVSGLPKNQVCGMAGMLDAGRWRAFIAMELNVSVEDIAGTVLGGHGPTMVPLPRLTTVGGVPLTEIMDAETIDRITTRTRKAGGEIVGLLGNGSAFFSPAYSAISMAESYLKDKRRVMPLAALCEGEFGVDGLYVGVPCVIGAGGVERIIEIELNADEQKAFDASVDHVQTLVSQIEL